jgi:hypothetical protein
LHAAQAAISKVGVQMHAEQAIWKQSRGRSSGRTLASLTGTVPGKFAG